MKIKELWNKFSRWYVELNMTLLASVLTGKNLFKYRNKAICKHAYRRLTQKKQIEWDGFDDSSQEVGAYYKWACKLRKDAKPFDDCGNIRNFECARYEAGER